MVGWLRMFSIQGFLTWQYKLLMTYKHLSQAERYQIHAPMKAGHDQSQIAKLLDRHKSTISWELSRNTGSRGYRTKQASEISADRAQHSRNAPTVEPWVREAVVDKLQPMAAKVKTLTFDNGKEFAGHAHIDQQLQTAYFARPFASWERGQQ